MLTDERKEVAHIWDSKPFLLAVAGATVAVIYCSSESGMETQAPVVAGRPPVGTRDATPHGMSDVGTPGGASAKMASGQSAQLPKSVAGAQHPDAIAERSAKTHFSNVGLEPRTLDEYRSVPDEGGAQPGIVKQGEAYEYKRTQAVLQRAGDVLRSGQTHLQGDAINELADMTESSAGESLIDVINRFQGIDAEYRFRAVAALARHAEVTQFSDIPAALALVQLASDGDPDVRSIATETLLQMNRLHDPANTSN